MLQIFINDVPGTVDAPPQTWGDLLANLDQQVAAQGLMLAAARFDGVDQPSFRDPEVTARRLADIRRVDVEAATPAALLRSCLVEALVPLRRAADTTLELSGSYRTADLAGCHEGLTSLAAELRGLMSLVSMLCALQIDLDAFSSNGTTAADQIDRFASALDAVVAAQESEDWLTVADVLEYDLEPAIRHWVALLSAIIERL